MGLLKRASIGCAVVPVLLLAALVLWPQAPPHPTGAWMARAGVSPRYVEAGGQRIRYVRRGSGRPLVLVHGFASSIYT